ncbi:MAG: hypothetical protein M1819_006447 [Sarea resinae]|nr:MAG: hypothetical protein M1819_006447 [Sarea resinae]
MSSPPSGGSEAMKRPRPSLTDDEPETKRHKSVLFVKKRQIHDRPDSRDLAPVCSRYQQAEATGQMSYDRNLEGAAGDSSVASESRRESALNETSMARIPTGHENSKSLEGNKPRWRVGDPHEEVCFSCKGGGRLIGCVTCPRSYHPGCLTPPLSPQHQPDSWYCEVCMDNHDQPPACSPLPSPVTSPQPRSASLKGASGPEHAHKPAQSLVDASHHVNDPPACTNTIAHRVSSQDYGRRNGDSSSQGRLQPSIGARGEAEEFTRVGDRGRTAFQDRMREAPATGPKPASGKRSHEALNQHESPASPRPTSSSNRSLNAKEKPLRSSQSANARVSGKPATPAYSEDAASETREPSITFDPCPSRRSRYSTLPDEVEGALSVIYRELESGAQWQGLSKDLSSKVQILDQQLKISDGRLVLARQELESRQSSEVVLLRRDLAAKQAEIEALDEQNRKLRSELDNIKAQAKSKDEEMDKWRSRLRMMIDGPS